MPFFFLSIYFQPFIDRALEAQSVRSKGFARTTRLKGATPMRLHPGCLSNSQRATAGRYAIGTCRLPLSLFVALMASEHPEVRLYLCHQQPLLGSGGPSPAPSLSGPQALSQSPRVDIAALSCPPRAPLVPFAECTESHYCPIKALGSENEGSHKATHRGFGALTTLPGR